MAPRPVLLYPDPILKQVAAPVATEDVERIAQLLIETAATFGRCVGIAAPQIGELVRVAIVDVSEHPKAETSNGLIVLANPHVTAREGSEVAREGCLSLPDVTANVRRATRIEVKHLGGVLECEGFEARAVLHEIDHMDGILFLDRVESLVDDVFRRKSYAEGSAGSSERATGESSNASPGGRIG
ncbi:MAG: peptide deformylase [Solirubrobacterales bacterium]|nr:peptide deformylase [Solirubrobacterales bacterium]